MPKLKSARMERFAKLCVQGMPAARAYAEAGYSRKHGATNSWKLRHDPRVVTRIAELEIREAQAETRSKEIIAKQIALTKEHIVRALGPTVNGNLADFFTVGADGMPRVDFSRATYEQFAALQSLQIDEYQDDKDRVFDTKTGKFVGRQVRRVRFTMRNNVPAAMAVARLMQWIVEAPKTPPPEPFEERLKRMTPEERDADARRLYEKAQALLADHRRREAEEAQQRPTLVDVTPA